MLVVSYNPGYQSLLKALKPSTRQRFVAIEFGFPAPDRRSAMVAARERTAPGRVRAAGGLASALRALKGQDLEEGVSTRLVVYCATLIRDGLKPYVAIQAALIEPLTDDPDVRQGAGCASPRSRWADPPCRCSSPRRPSASTGIAWSAAPRPTGAIRTPPSRSVRCGRASA